MLQIHNYSSVHVFECLKKLEVVMLSSLLKLSTLLVFVALYSAAGPGILVFLL